MLFPRQILCLIGVVLLGACQTSGPPALSLAEAKKVTAQFAGSFTPPPKSIGGIRELVRQGVPQTWSCESSVDVTEETLARMMEGMPDKAGRDGRANFAASSASREFQRGNFQRAIRFMEMAIFSTSMRGARAGFYATLASYHAFAGNFDAADGAASQAANAASFLNRVRRRGRISERSRAWINFHLNESRGAIALSKGQLVTAEAHYLRSLEDIRPYYFGEGWNEYAKLGLAKSLIFQGRLVEAEVAVREILIYRLERAPLTVLNGQSLLVLSEILYEQGRYADAEALAADTVRLYSVLCVVPESLNLAGARNVRAKALVAQGRWDEALAQYEELRAGMATDPDSFERLFANQLGWALALLRSGRAEEAEDKLRAAYQRSRDHLGGQDYRTAEIGGFLAMARLAKGDRPGALDGFAGSTEVLLARSRDPDDEGATFRARDRRLDFILGAYVGLLADIRGTELEARAGVDPTAEAFRLAEVARSQRVLRALSASGARAALEDPELAELARREQDTGKQIAALMGRFNELIGLPIGKQNTGEIKELKATIERLRGARAALFDEIENRFPDYARLVNPKPATIADARAALRPGEALIATYVTDGRTFVWAVPKNGPPAFAAVDIGREDLADTVGLLRAALEPNARVLGDIPPFDTGTAHALYRDLLAPVRAGWKDADSLLVVAHGSLGYLPFAVLPTKPGAPGADAEHMFAGYRDVPWLVRDHAVTVLPSVASLRMLRGLPPGAAGRKAFVGFGDPFFSEAQVAAAADQAAGETETLTARGLTTRGLPVRLRAAPDTADLDSADLSRLPRLPDTADEILSMALALKADLTQDVFLGLRANEETIKTLDLSGYKVLAFATHGLAPGDLDGLRQPALALSAPEVAGVDGDGLLTLDEILGLRLDADWVVLSACNTGAGQGAGAEAVSGLGRAFFYAGTRALLVSNWPVETTSAKALTTDLFRRQAANDNLTRAEALRQSMLNLMDGPGYVDPESGKTVFSYAHPIFWAPFSLIGDGGGAKPQS